MYNIIDIITSICVYIYIYIHIYIYSEREREIIQGRAKSLQAFSNELRTGDRSLERNERMCYVVR